MCKLYSAQRQDTPACVGSQRRPTTTTCDKSPAPSPAVIGDSAQSQSLHQECKRFPRQHALQAAPVQDDATRAHTNGHDSAIGDSRWVHQTCKPCADDQGHISSAQAAFSEKRQSVGTCVGAGAPACCAAEAEVPKGSGTSAEKLLPECVDARREWCSDATLLADEQRTKASYILNSSSPSAWGRADVPGVCVAPCVMLRGRHVVPGETPPICGAAGTSLSLQSATRTRERP